MKRVVNNSVIDIEFDVYLPVAEYEIAATDILDLPDTRNEADPLALENFDAFIESVEEIFEYYDFKRYKPRTSEFSTYAYYAHISQIEARNVPKYVRLRISSHIMQRKSEEHERKIRDTMRQELQEIKLPPEKFKQRYTPLYITADRTLGFNTYEEVLDYAEERVRKLFEDLHITVPLSDYDRIGPF